MLSPDRIPRLTVSSNWSRRRSRYGRARNTRSGVSWLARLTIRAPRRYVPDCISRSRKPSCASTSTYRWTELLGIPVAATSWNSDAPVLTAAPTSRRIRQVLRIARVPAIDWASSAATARLPCFGKNNHSLLFMGHDTHVLDCTGSRCQPVGMERSSTVAEARGVGPRAAV